MEGRGEHSWEREGNIHKWLVMALQDMSHRSACLSLQTCSSPSQLGSHATSTPHTSSHTSAIERFLTLVHEQWPKSLRCCQLVEHKESWKKVRQRPMCSDVWVKMSDVPAALRRRWQLPYIAASHAVQHLCSTGEDASDQLCVDLMILTHTHSLLSTLAFLLYLDFKPFPALYTVVLLA